MLSLLLHFILLDFRVGFANCDTYNKKELKIINIIHSWIPWRKEGINVTAPIVCHNFGTLPIPILQLNFFVGNNLKKKPDISQELNDSRKNDEIKFEQTEQQSVVETPNIFTTKKKKPGFEYS